MCLGLRKSNVTPPYPILQPQNPQQCFLWAIPGTSTPIICVARLPASGEHPHFASDFGQVHEIMYCIWPDTHLPCVLKNFHDLHWKIIWVPCILTCDLPWPILRDHHILNISPLPLSSPSLFPPQDLVLSVLLPSQAKSGQPQSSLYSMCTFPVTFLNTLSAKIFGMADYALGGSCK